MTTPPPNTPPADKDKDKDGLTAGTIRKFIRDEIVNLLPKTPGTNPTPDAGATPGTGQPRDIKSEVAEALKLLKSKEDRDERDARLDKVLEAYEKPEEEITPVERRRVEKIMRWGE